jgi:hypothetical protein
MATPLAAAAAGAASSASSSDDGGLNWPGDGDRIRTCEACGHASAPASSVEAVAPRAWKKVLYEAQPYADNYIPESFLSSAIMNANVQHFSFLDMVRESGAINTVVSHVSAPLSLTSVFLCLMEQPTLTSTSCVCLLPGPCAVSVCVCVCVCLGEQVKETCPVTQQVAIVALFHFVYMRCQSEMMGPSSLIVVDLCLFLFGYTVCAILRWMYPRLVGEKDTEAEFLEYFASLKKTAGSEGDATPFKATTGLDVLGGVNAASTGNGGSMMTMANAVTPPAVVSTASSNPSVASTAAGSAAASGAGVAMAAGAVSSSTSTSAVAAVAADTVASAAPVASHPTVSTVVVTPGPIMSLAPVGAGGAWGILLSMLPNCCIGVFVTMASFVDAAARIFVFCGVVHTLSPILKTLTQSFSDDTIFSLTGLFSTLHITLFDYDGICATAPDFSGTTSLNAAIFSSVLLASRLSSSLHVFAFICFAFELFAGAPIVLAAVKRASNNGWVHWLGTLLLTCLALWALTTMSAVLSLTYVIVVILVTFVCPAGLKYYQRYKNEIQGPWDYDDRKELDEL